MTDVYPADAALTDIAAAAPAPARKFEKVALEEPIARGENQLTEFTLRKPHAGELRGTTMQDLLTSDVDALLKVIPRISSPNLTPHEAAMLDPADLAQCAGIIRGFFLTAAERKMMDAMIAGQTSTS